MKDELFNPATEGLTIAEKQALQDFQSRINTETGDSKSHHIGIETPEMAVNDFPD
jgi:hypothetical protein